MYQFQSDHPKRLHSLRFSSDVVYFSMKLHRGGPRFFSMQVAHTRVDPEFPLDPEAYPGSVRAPRICQAIARKRC